MTPSVPIWRACSPRSACSGNVADRYVRADPARSSDPMTRLRRASGPVIPVRRPEESALATEPADVLIVGAGASGGVVARRLAEAGFQGRLPRAGRLARPGGVPRRRARLGAHHAQAVVDEPEHPRPARGLPDRRVRRGGLAADVLGGRRLDAHLRRRLAADAAVGLPRPLARRRRRRLAADLRRAAAVLRADATASSASRAWAATRPTRRGRGPAAAAAPDRRRRAEGRPGPYPAGLALVAGAQLDPVGPVRRAPSVRAARHVPAGLRRGRQGVDRPDALAEGDRERARGW